MTAKEIWENIVNDQNFWRSVRFESSIEVKAAENHPYGAEEYAKNRIAKIREELHNDDTSSYRIYMRWAEYNFCNIFNMPSVLSGILDYYDNLLNRLYVETRDVLRENNLWGAEGLRSIEASMKKFETGIDDGLRRYCRILYIHNRLLKIIEKTANSTDANNLRFTKKQIAYIFDCLVQNGYINITESNKNDVLARFWDMYLYPNSNPTSIEIKISWIKKNRNNNGVAKGALVELLRLLNKSKVEIRNIYNVYFTGKKWGEWEDSYYRDTHSQYYDMLQRIVSDAENII